MEITISFTDPSGGSSSVSANTVKTIFGLPNQTNNRTLLRDLPFDPKGITYITGFSGSGKSSLLKAISREYAAATPEIPVQDPSQRTVDSIDAPPEKVIQWLGRFGLGEARVLLTPIHCLSEGQRARLSLALLLWKKPPLVIIDEFLSSLDRLTARVIAFQFQKILRKLNLSCVVATAHSDLEDALLPDRTIDLDLEGVFHIRQRTASEIANAILPELDEIKIENGRLEDFESLKRFHYIDSPLGEVVALRVAKFRGKSVGVRVYTKLYPKVFEKISVFKEINSRAVLSARVIVHPAFRGLGISRLLDGSHPDLDAYDAIFTHSALAQFLPFDLRSNYILTQHPSMEDSEWSKELEMALKELGAPPFHDLYDQDHREAFLQTLPATQVSFLKHLVGCALGDYDFRHFKYLCEHLKIELSPAELLQLEEFFNKYCKHMAHNHLSSVLTEALSFPMQGLVRKKC